MLQYVYVHCTCKWGARNAWLVMTLQYLLSTFELFLALLASDNTLVCRPLQKFA